MKILVNLLTLFATIGINLVFLIKQAKYKIFITSTVNIQVFEVFFGKSNNLILRRNKFSKHEMLHQPGHVLQGVNSGDKSQVTLTDQSIHDNPNPVRGGLLLPQGDPA